jgi:hypothetical protein
VCRASRQRWTSKPPVALRRAFIVALLKLRPFEAVPVIIVVTLVVAILLIHVTLGRAGDFAQFGFRFCQYRYIAAAIVFSVPIVWAPMRSSMLLLTFCE